MLKPLCVCLAAVVAAISLPGAANAQRGTGKTVGLARQGIRPAIEQMSGVIADIKTGPCEKTTGRSLSGTHLLVQTPDRGVINLHLGPSSFIQGVGQPFARGVAISFEAFRTNRLPADAFIARSVTAGGKTIVLRDTNNRPQWAGGGGGGGGRGFGMRGGGGRGPGWGYGRGRGPGWL